MKKLVVFVATMMTVITASAQTQDSLGVDTLDIWKDVNLSEVVVKSTLPKTRIKGDAQITRIPGTILEKAGSSIDLLSKLPLVKASGESVSVVGRGDAEVYINGRRVDDKKELSQLQSDRIARVEVVQNPGARYSASTRAVIRIYLKKAQGEGFSLDNETHYAYKYGHEIWENLAMNYRTGGFDVGVTLWGQRTVTGKISDDWTDTYLADMWHQEMKVDLKNKMYHFSPTLTLNWQINDNHSIGMRYSYYRQPEVQAYDSYIRTDVFKNDKAIEYSHSDLLHGGSSWNHATNFYYSGKVNDWQIDVNSDLYFSGDRAKNKTNETMKDLMDQSQTSLLVEANTRNRGDLYAIKATASHPLWGGQFTFGTEDSYTHRTTTYQNPQHIVKDDDNKINETMLAAFIDYNHAIGKAWIGAGLRFEHTDNSYYEFGKRMDEQSKNYNDWFPNVNVVFPLGKIAEAPVQASISYARKITRPPYAMLRTSVYYDNKYMLEGGNPLLDPQYDDDLAFNAAWKWLNFSATFSHLKNQYTLFSEPYKDANGVEHPEVSYMHPVELEPYNCWNLNFFASPTFGRLPNGSPIWSPQFYAYLSGQHFRADTKDGKVLFNHPILSTGLNNHFALPHDWHIMVNYSFMSRGHVHNVYMKGFQQSFNFTIMKQWMKGKLETRLIVSDPFQQSIQDAVVYNGIRELEDRMLNPRQFTFILRYKFNVAGSKYKGQNAGSSQKNRM